MNPIADACTPGYCPQCGIVHTEQDILDYSIEEFKRQFEEKSFVSFLRP